MLNISYNLSPKLKDYLYAIEKLRRSILLPPLSPKTKLMLRWEATFDRICAYAFFSKNPLGKNEISKLLEENSPKKLSKNQETIIKYKEAIDYVLQNWLGSANQINSQDILKIYQIVSNGRLSVPEEELEYLFNYLQLSVENPIIQSAIVYIELMKMEPFTKDNEIISLLAALLFLYKYGYDFRGLLAFENEWIENNSSYRQNYELAMRAPTLTLWLEYFAGSILRSLEKASQKLSKGREIARELPKSFWELNDRQKSILAYLQKPEISITNRKVQKRYRVSQITASRDLTRLTNLGLLFSHGNGRSVYYTRV
ncbi:hypothetical protein HYT32_00040 [Candidatus Roizmanbacteria bacterium]|nr:hypothetical protein [Candidatus Roizmanbacteria bacterium]